MRSLFLMDPIASISILKDTSFALMLAAQARGHALYYATLDAMYAEDGQPMVHAVPVRVQEVKGAHAELGSSERLPLTSFELIWMRKDPPVDASFLAATWLLDLAADQGVEVINRPSGLRDCNEKAVILRFPEVTPPTAIATRREELDRLAEAWGGRAVVKPLDGMGGRGIFLWRTDDPNRGAIWEVSTDYGQRPIMVQGFLEAFAEGDKRVLLMDGEPVGAVLRVPASGELRGNLAAGGKAVEAPLDDADLRIIERVRPFLHARGLRFVGLDVIGGCLTELNVTSPTGLQEASRFSGQNLADSVVASAEAGPWSS